MSYIGREPQVGNFQVCDAISVVNGQAAYTMQVSSVNVSPETANHMIVSLNGIIQAPGSSYTVSGSTITFASNLVTGDVIDFIHILGSVLDLGVPSDSTVSLAKLTATGTKDATTFLRGDNTFAAAGGANTPAFRAYSSSAQSLSSGVTAVQQLATENFDTDSCYDTSTYRFTPNVAGKYFVYAECNVDVGNTNLQELYCFIIKNTTLEAQNALDLRSSYFGADSGTYVATVVDMNGSSDYLEFKVYCTVSSGSISALDGTAKRYFGAYKIIT
jgi:hypothetical protein